jgi:hypothetical protein
MYNILSEAKTFILFSEKKIQHNEIKTSCIKHPSDGEINIHFYENVSDFKQKILNLVFFPAVTSV